MGPVAGMVSEVITTTGRMLDCGFVNSAVGISVQGIFFGSNQFSHLTCLMYSYFKVSEIELVIAQSLSKILILLE